jgi:hypothetical protein
MFKRTLIGTSCLVAGACAFGMALADEPVKKGFVPEKAPTMRVHPLEKVAALNEAALDFNVGPVISYAVISQSLSSLADAFSKATGKSVTVDGAGDAPVRNIRFNGTLPVVLKALNKNQGVLWWSDGAKYTMASGAGTSIKRLPLGDLPTGEARGLIARTFPAFSDGLIELDEASRAIVVRGPKGAFDEMDSALKAAKAITTQGITVVRFGRNGS